MKKRYVITKPGTGVPRNVVASFTFDEDRILFDMSRSDAEFVSTLTTLGVPVPDHDHRIKHIKPTQAKEFVDACLLRFSSVHLSCSDEDALDHLRRRFPSPPRRDRNSVPPSAA